MINTYKRTHTYKLFHQLGVIVYPSILSWFSFQVFEFSEALLIGVTGMKLLVQEIFVYFFVFLKYNSLIKRTVSCIHYVVQILLQHWYVDELLNLSHHHNVLQKKEHIRNTIG